MGYSILTIYKKGKVNYLGVSPLQFRYTMRKSAQHGKEKERKRKKKKGGEKEKGKKTLLLVPTEDVPQHICRLSGQQVLS